MTTINLYCMACKKEVEVIHLCLQDHIDGIITVEDVFLKCGHSKKQRFNPFPENSCNKTNKEKEQ